MHRASLATRHANATADANRLDGRNGHQRLREPPIQLAVPLDVAAEAGWNAVGDRPRSCRPWCRPRRGPRRFRPSSRASTSAIDAVQRRVVRNGFASDQSVTSSGSGTEHGPDDGRHGCDPDADGREELARDRADGDARGGFARAGAFEDVADVVVAVLDDAGEVGVTRARPRDRRTIDAGRVGAARPPRRPSCAASSPSPCSESGARSGAPVVTPCADAAQTRRRDRIRSAMRRPRPYPPCRRRNCAVIACEVDRETRRHALEDRDERPAVRFARSEKSQHAGSFYPKYLQCPGRLRPNFRTIRPGKVLALRPGAYVRARGFSRAASWRIAWS